MVVIRIANPNFPEPFVVNAPTSSRQGADVFAPTWFRCLLPALSLLVCANALGETTRCQNQQVEFIVGGGAPLRNCTAPMGAPQPATASRTGAPSALREAPSVRVSANIDDTGRREILQQELNKTRNALSELDKRSSAQSSTDAAQAQRTRYAADIAALEAEIRRIK